MKEKDIVFETLGKALGTPNRRTPLASLLFDAFSCSSLLPERKKIAMPDLIKVGNRNKICPVCKKKNKKCICGTYKE
jgi:hypothetical protein